MTLTIIAEIGINHNGDMNICKQLIDVAAQAGVDAVKFQKRDIDAVYTAEFLAEPRESPWGNTQRDPKEGLEFGKDDYIEIDRYCKEQGLEWFASAWDHNSLEFLKAFDTKFNKVASAMAVSENFLEAVAAEKKHTFISTGMCTYEEIGRATEIFKLAGCPFELMHTVSTYPMKDEHANLKVIDTLKSKFECNVGYSGHEVGLAISYAAVAFGITSLERHITLDRSMYGSDQSASIEPGGLRQLVGAARKIEKALGDGEKRILDEEKPIAAKLRAHLEH